mgnify:CR=1 FL=1
MYNTPFYAKWEKDFESLWSNSMCNIKGEKPHHLVAILSVSRNRYYKTQRMHFFITKEKQVWTYVVCFESIWNIDNGKLGEL